LQGAGDTGCRRQGAPITLADKALTQATLGTCLCLLLEGNNWASLQAWLRRDLSKLRLKTSSQNKLLQVQAIRVSPSIEEDNFK
jgi:hypothetical protein